MNLWLRYPLGKALAFFEWPDHRFKIMSHVLRVGPLAFAVIWKEAVK